VLLLLETKIRRLVHGCFGTRVDDDTT
jgi:hypothetical protein